MQCRCALWLVTLAIVQSFVAGLPKHNEDHARLHETRSIVHGQEQKSRQTLLNTAPLRLRIGLKTMRVPQETSHDNTTDKGIQTESETTTKIKNGVKTVTTVTKQVKNDKNNKTQVIAQTIEKVSTNVWDHNKPEEFKVQLKAQKNPAFRFSIFNPFGIGQLLADEPTKQCSTKKHCKKPGMYCDRMDNQCRKKVKLGEQCDQAGQCDTGVDKQQVACLWGRCTLITKSAGYAGVFCKKNKDCGSEELHCALQPDISEVSKVCIYKLSEGQTCGRSSIFSFLPLGGMARDMPCKKGFACQELSFTGRKICRRAGDQDNEDDEEE